MSKPSREELVKYWALQKYLDYCFTKCSDGACPVWSEDCATFKIEHIAYCPYESMRKAFSLLHKMTADKPPAYYAVNIEQYNEIMEEVDKKFKEKVVKI